MILTDYYRFEKKPGQNSKMRMDCTASTQSYNPFEALRNKNNVLFVYVGDNSYTEAGERGKSDLALSRGEHITSLNTLYPEQPFWYGDFHKTPDALLMIHKGFERYADGRVADGSTIETPVELAVPDDIALLLRSVIISVDRQDGVDAVSDV